MILLSFLVIFILQKEISSYKQNGCKCPEKSPSPPKTIKDDPKFVQGEVYNKNGDTNLGKPMVVKDFIFLPNAPYVGYGAAGVPNDCPEGYRLPTKDEVDKLLAAIGNNVYDFLTDPKGLNLDPRLKYYTGTRAGSDYYYFYGLTLDSSKKTYKFGSMQVNMNVGTNSGRCIFDSEKVNLKIEGKDYDLIVNRKKKYSINEKSIKGYLWRVDDETYTTKEASISVENRGCHLLETWGKAINDKILYTCDVIYSRYPYEMNATSNFDLTYVKTINTTYNTTRKTGFHFAEAQAPVAPKANGGYYVTFYDSYNKKIRVLEYLKEDKIYKNKELPYEAYPMDIIETDYGFAIYAKYVSNTHHSFVIGYNYDYTKRFETTIMNNGANAKVHKEGIQFFDSSGNPEFGLDAMYSPHNGKLNYGRGCLCLIFAHYNYFGASSGGHTGDTFYIFDESGKAEKVRYAWSWEASHSLIQSHIYDGRYFVTGALGDAYPMGINLCLVDVTKQTNSLDKKRNSYPQVYYAVNSSIVPYILGSGTGSAMGRLGGVLDFGDYYVCVYSIKKSENRTLDGIFLSKYTYDGSRLQKIGNYVTIKPNCAGSLSQLRAARYGNRILITYILSSYDFGLSYPSAYESKTEKMYYMLVDTNGKIIKDAIEGKAQEQALNEDLRQLRDGSLRWAYADRKGFINILKVDIDNKPNIPYFEDRVDSEGLSGWIIALIVILCLLVVGAVGYVVYLKYIKKRPDLIPFGIGRLLGDKEMR